MNKKVVKSTDSLCLSCGRYTKNRCKSCLQPVCLNCSFKGRCYNCMDRDEYYHNVERKK